MMHIVFMIGALFFAAAHAAERAEEFDARAELSFAPGHAIYQVEVPLAVHRRARRADLGDLRVFNGAGEIVPHALRAVTASEPKAEPLVDAAIFPYRAALKAADLGGSADAKIELRPGGAVVIDVRAGKVAAPAEPRVSAYFFDVGGTEKAFKALSLDWDPDADGFSGRVDLHASDDLRAWRPLMTGAALLDLQMSGQRLELRRIEFAAVRTRYLRMTWPEAQRMPAVRSARIEPVAPRPERVPRVVEQEAQRGEKEGAYIVDLGGPLAVQKVQVELPQRNTVTTIELSARARGSDPWQHVDRATYYRMLHAGQEWRNPERSIATRSARYWLLEVDSRGGGLGQGLPKLRVTWEPRMLVFVARGEGPFALSVGHESYGPAAFNVESLIPGLVEGKPVPVASATLGPLEATPGSAAAEKPRRELLERLTGEQGRRWLLWAILIAGVAILAVMAWRMAKGLGSPERRD